MPNPHLPHEHRWIEDLTLCSVDRVLRCACGAILTEPRPATQKDVNGL